MVDIFKDTKEKVMPSWAKFETAGDSVQGTYVGKIIGQKDGYGNEQIIYQLLQEGGEIVNVGFGLNKKFINQDMDAVSFGQIVGFKYKGKIDVKDKFGKAVQVKDFGLHQDPKIVNETWLETNKDDMPMVTTVEDSIEQSNREFEGFEGNADTVSEADIGKSKAEIEKNKEGKEGEDVPFSSEESLTEEDKLVVIEKLSEEDKLAVIEKLSKDKLGTTDLESAKVKIMETLSVAFIPINYDEIIKKLSALTTL